MEPRSLHYATTACVGELRQGAPGARADRVCTDSRQAQAGDLFVPLVGERFDGHDFIGEVASHGPAAVLVNRARADSVPPGCPAIVVDDTRAALGRLAARYRRDFTLAVVVVAGSNGKTTTKELIASVLKQKITTLWSESSFNNDIGVPLTLLQLETAHEAAVLEAGTNHPGELAPLVRMIEPQYGVITNVGREHLEFFGDLAGVAQEEGQLAELLPPDGMLLVNGDDQWSDRIVARTRARVVRVGVGEHNDWRARAIRPDKKGVSFEVEAPVAELSGLYRIQLIGRHQAINALFALAVGEELGLGRAELLRGLADCPQLKMRMQIVEHHGVTVLNDAYNANVDSMRAALQTLSELPCDGRRIAVLGDMAELGDYAVAAHEVVGTTTAQIGIGQLFAVGKHAGVMVAGARAAGLNRVFEFADVDTAAHAIKSFVKPGDLMLLKASRVTGLERVLETLRGEVLKKTGAALQR